MTAKVTTTYTYYLYISDVIHYKNIHYYSISSYTEITNRCYKWKSQLLFVSFLKVKLKD